MTTRTPYETLLQDWAKEVSGLVPVIFTDQPGPRPAVDFVALNVGTVLRIGQPSSRVKDEAFGGDYKGELTTSWRGVLSVNTYGDTSWDLLQGLIRSLDKSTIQEANRARGIAVVDNGPPVNLTTNVGTDYERRWQSDFLFRWDDVHSFAAAAVETATATQV